MKQNRSFCLLTGATLVSSALHPARADLQSYFGFGLDGYVGGNAFSSYLSLDDNFRFNSGQARLDGEGFRAAAGDLSGDFDSLSLSNRAFQGIQATVPSGRSEFTAIAGRTVMPLSLLDLVQRPGGFFDRADIRDTSSIYGLRGSYSLSENLKVNASQLFTPDSSSLEGKTISNASLVYAPDSNRRLSLEGALSRRGQGFQLSGEQKKKRYSVQASYRQADREFSTAGNLNLRTNRSGYNVGGSYLLAPNTTLGGTSYRYNDGFGGHSRLDSVAMNFALPKAGRYLGNIPRVSMTYQNRELQSSEITNGLRQRLSGPGIHLSSQIKKVSYQAGFDQLNLTSGSTRDDIKRFSFSMGRKVGRASSLYFLGVLNHERKNDFTGRTHDLLTSLNYSRSFKHNSFMLQTGLERRQVTSQDDRGIEGSSYAMRFGLSIPVGGSDRVVSFDYRRQLSSSGDISGALGNDVLYLSYRQSISIGRAPAQFATRQISEADRRELGQVVAHVYEDTNLNGKRDEGEPGVPNVLVGITDDVRARTDANGDAHFVNLPPNQYNMRLVVPSLPIELTILNGYERDVNLGGRQNLSFDFPISRTGEISGTVFNDLNRNGKRDQGEDGLADALVRIDGTEIIGFSGPDGHYLLTNVPPGTQKVSIDTEFLSSGGQTFTSTNSPVTLSLAPGGKSEIGDLGVAVSETPIVIGQLPGIAPQPVSGEGPEPVRPNPVAGNAVVPPTLLPIALR